MSSIAALTRRIDKMLEALTEQQKARARLDQVKIYLPILDSEPPVPYKIGSISFYVPEHRVSERAYEP